jgi:fucose 4-O-acetylase-like acetyltransferase
LVAVDVLRGIAIVAVVVYHVAAQTRSGPVTPVLRGYNPMLIGVLCTFHVPALMFVAGGLYGLTKSREKGGRNRETYSTFIRKKAMRLLVPCAVVGLLDWIARFVLGDAVSPASIPVYMVPFFVAPLLPRSVAGMTPMLVCSYGLSMVIWDVSDFLSFSQAAQVAPYFLLGYTFGLLGDRGVQWRPPCFVRAIAMLLAAALTWLVVSDSAHAALQGLLWKAEPLTRLVSAINVVALWMLASIEAGPLLRAGRTALSSLGRQSMAIYLFHVPAILPIRMLLHHLGISQEATHLVTNSFVGIVVPWFCAKFIIARIPLLGGLLLGTPVGRRPSMGS